MATIGFLGLGNMGRPMAANLVAAGHQVRGYDPVPEAMSAATTEGIEHAAAPADAATGADIVITMLPAGAHVREAYEGEGGLLRRAAPETLLIDCSTIDVDAARTVHAAASAAGFAMLDAPVSGGVSGAAAGTLTFMVGGDAAAFARAEPVLAVMGETLVHAGGAGAGQAAKICNNLMLGIQMISVAEAFSLAEKLGLSAQTLFDISSKSSGSCWSLVRYCPVPGPVPTAPSNRDFAPGFTAAMMLKDLRLAEAAAAGADADTPLGNRATELYQAFVDGGDGTLDFSGIIRMIRGA